MQFNEYAFYRIMGNVKLPIVFSEQAMLDAFQRLRVSEPYELLENKQIYDLQPNFWSSKTLTGSAITFTSGSGATTLTVSNSSGSFAARQTKRRLLYQPGKSVEFMGTSVFGGSVSGIVKRYGIFDTNDGIFLQQSGSTVSWIIRSSGSVFRQADQGDWNLDKLDGYGSSGKTLDLSKVQISLIDFEWLGAGRVRCGFVIDGKKLYTHQFLFANVITGTYMGNPNLPVRVEMKNETNAASANMSHICFTISSEGGLEQKGSSFTIDNGYGSGRSVLSGSYTPILSLRLNSSKLGTHVVPIMSSVLCTTNTNFRWALLRNPALSGSDNASWQNVPNSNAQYDVSRTNTILSEGTVLYSGYGSAVAQQGHQGASNVGNVSIFGSGDVLGSDIDGVSDELVLAIRHFDTNANTFYSSLTYREVM
jgi:hypothetical protein